VTGCNAPCHSLQGYGNPVSDAAFRQTRYQPVSRRFRRRRDQRICVDEAVYSRVVIDDRRAVAVPFGGDFDDSTDAELAQRVPHRNIGRGFLQLPADKGVGCQDRYLVVILGELQAVPQPRQPPPSSINVFNRRASPVLPKPLFAPGRHCGASEKTEERKRTAVHE